MHLSRSWRFFLSQALWMLQSFFSLVFAMGGGLKWMLMSVRVLLFGLLIFPAYSYHIVWYVVSPTVIRRVAYRASRTTKLHNLRILLREQDAMEEMLEATARGGVSGAAATHNTTTTGGTTAKAGASARPSPVKKALFLNLSGGEAGTGITTTDVHAAAGGPLGDGTAATGLRHVASLHHLDEISSRVSTQVNDADGSLLYAPIAMSPAAMTPLRHHRLSLVFDTTAEVQGSGLLSSFAADGFFGDAARPLCHSPLNDTADCVEELLSKTLRPMSPTGGNAGTSGSHNKKAGESSLYDQEQPAAGHATADADSSSSSSSSSRDSEEEDPEDAVNLHNRAFLDIFLPLSLDSLMKAFHPAQGGPMAAASGRRRRRFPIVVIVGGGAWIIGCNLWAALMAKLFAAAGYLAFTPDYRNFPQATMEEMVVDVSDSIAWVVKNAERYNGDTDDITVIGQSAGAHLTMMSMLSQARVCSLRRARQQQQQQQQFGFNDSTSGAAGGNSFFASTSSVVDPTAAAKAGLSFTASGEQRLPPSTGHPADVPVHLDELDLLGKATKAVYNRLRYNPRTCIRRYVGLSGIYNVKGLAPYLHKRGLYKHVMYRLTGGKQHLAQFSVPYYFDLERCSETGDPLPQDAFDFLPPTMDFLHGRMDQSAPISESTALVAQMRRFQAHARRAARQQREGKDGPIPASDPTAKDADEGATSSSSSSSSNPPVAVRMFAIPDASHTDPFVDELLCGKGCVIQHCQRSSARGRSPGAASPVMQRGGDDDGEQELALTVTAAKRPFLLTVARYVCPF